MKKTIRYILFYVFAVGLVACTASAQNMLSGRIYEGQTGIEPPDSEPMAGVTVNLYGTENAGQMGTYITHTTSDSDGWYGLLFSVRINNYAYYNIVATTPVGYTYEGATSVNGTVRANDWIQYEYAQVGHTTTGNKFWFKLITVKENQAPVVFTGNDQVECDPILLPYPRPMAGQVSDDGLPKGQELVIEWSMVSGPGEVEFENIGDPETTAHFYAYGTYVLRLTAFDGEFEASDDVTIKIGESVLEPVHPDQLVGVNIGGALPSGSIDLQGDCSGGVTVTAGGTDIWGITDQFHYAYADIDLPPGGNSTAVVRVNSMGPSGSNGWAKAGIMFRQSFEPGSPHAMIVRTPGNGIALQGRDTQGGESWHVPVGLTGWSIDEVDTVWLRLDHVGNTVIGSCALDFGVPNIPEVWTASAYHEVPAQAHYFALGLATTSHEQGVPMTATYCDFRIGSYLGPPTLIGPGLMAYYTFDEGDGSVAHDSSGFGRHGTLVGDVQWVDGPPGLGGAVREFAGGHVSIGSDDSAQIAEAISSTGQITLMAWVKMPDPPYAQWDIIRKGPDTWGLYAVQNGLGFGFRVASNQYIKATSEVVPGLWQHIAGAYDGEWLRLYVNGERVSSKPYAGPIAENDSDITIGEGIVDSRWKSNVRIYNEALSQGEIAEIAAIPTQPEPGLVAHYTFDEGEGAVAHDCSGYGYRATLMGDPCWVAAIPINIPGIALQFDGIDDYVDCGTFNPSAATGQITVAVWAKWNGPTGQWQGLIGKRDTWAAHDMMWQIECDRTTGVVRAQREGIADILDPSFVLQIGKWEHVAFTFDGSIGRLYRNGTAVASGPYSFGTDPEAAVVFGACQANGGNPFNGALADVRIYDRALSPGEIADRFGPAE